ncbi:MAG: hypothetical protein CSYNP_02889 [Syntrophus sp. SKADARSKE-3]|nr:hypothetical protein [Syntrophus sp. SKADARSKE-3]
MKKICFFASLVFLATLCLTAVVQAGDTMVIYFKNGQTQNVDLGSVSRIEFSGGTSRTTATNFPAISSGRTYEIKAKHSGRCLDIAGVGMQNAANAQQWDCHGGPNQQWTLTDKGGGYFLVIAKHSGKCLDVTGPSTADGANVYQWDCHGGDNQLWQFIPQGQGYYMVTAKHSSKCLDVAGAGKGNGDNVYQWSCHGGDNQLWRLK